MKRVSILALCAVALLALVLVPVLSAAPKAAGDKPRIAVLEFKNKADNQWWYHGGATAAQDVFVTELVKSGKFTVVEREQLDAMMKEKGLQQSGDIDPKTAIKLGKIIVECSTEGASIAYRVGKNLPASETGHWNLYSRPVDVPAGETIQCKACRLGYRDSQIVSRTMP